MKLFIQVLLLIYMSTVMTGVEPALGKNLFTVRKITLEQR